MKIVICDGEPVVRGQIRDFIISGDEDAHILEVSSTEDLAEETDMDMLFLGIPLEDARGIRTARWQRGDGREIPVIFVTAIKEETFVFNTKKKNYTLKAGQILYAENAGKRIVLHTTQEDIVIYGSMKDLEQRLGSRFYRCHRGYLVNLAHVSGYKGNSVQMDNGDQVYLSRSKYGGFVQTYMNFLQ